MDIAVALSQTISLPSLIQMFLEHIYCAICGNICARCDSFDKPSKGALISTHTRAPHVISRACGFAQYYQSRLYPESQSESQRIPPTLPQPVGLHPKLCTSIRIAA